MSNEKIERWRIGDKIYGQYEWMVYDSYEDAIKGKEKTIKELIKDYLEQEMNQVRDELERENECIPEDEIESVTEEEIRETALTNIKEHIWIARARAKPQNDIAISAYNIVELYDRSIFLFVREVQPEEFENANFSKITKDTIPTEEAGYQKIDLANGESYWFESDDLDSDLDDFE